LSNEETDISGGDNDEGSGAILGVAIIAATMLATGLVVTTFAMLALQQGVHNAADAAALAAADTASGAIAGFPCEAAAQAATLNGATVSSCTVGGLVADINVERAAGPFVLRSRSRAGPPTELAE
jgi:secretion/DNA translocation related TadE-like protein